MSVKRTYNNIFEDNDLLVINKPAGMLCIPGRFPSREPSLLEHLRSEYDQVLTIHRIDSGTSGIVVFARNETTHRMLSAQFANRQVHKIYVAIVAGHPPADEGVIDIALKTLSNGTVKTDRQGKPSITEYRVINRFQGYSHLALQPLTGRQHQIRVHLQAIGCPLMIDPLYGSPDPISIADIKSRRLKVGDRAPRPLLMRTPLHAESLTLVDPEGRQRQWQAAMPKDMTATLHQLQKWRSVFDH